MSPATFKDQAVIGKYGSRPVLKVVSDDITTRLSFTSYTKNSGDDLMKIEQYGEEIHLYIKKR